jgi:HAD superfamily hydrolase (TIGR01509 family)
MSKLPRNFPPSLSAVVFDFDETMIDLERQHTTAYERICAALGSDYAAMPEIFRKASGRRVLDHMREMRASFGWTRSVDDVFAERQRYFDEECRRSDLHLMPGVERTVRALYELGLTLAVTSSAVRDSIETILHRFGLRDLFTVIVDGSEVERGKPDPEAYRVTAARLSVDPADCVVFEDSEVGVASAKTAGMYCIAVRNPHAQTWQNLDAADCVVSSFDEVDAAWFATSSLSGR